MAELLNLEDEEKDQGKQTLATSLGTQPQTSATPQAEATGGPKGSGFAPLLGKYIEANRPQLESGGIVGQIQARPQQQAQGLQQDISNLQGQTEQGLGKVKSELESGKQAIQSVFDKPQEFIAQSQQPSDEFSAFENLRAKGYLGNIQGLQPQTGQLQSRLSDLQQSVQDASTEQGRFNLLQKTFGGGSQPYTRGMQALDQLLLQGVPQASEQLSQSLQQSIDPLQAQLQGITDVYTPQAEELTNLGNQYQQELLNKFGGGISDIENTIQGRQQQASDYLNQINQQIGSYTGGASLTPELANILGISQGQSLYGLTADDLRGLVQGEDIRTGDNLGAFANPEEQARIQALSELSGLSGELPSFQATGEYVGGVPVSAPNLQSELAAREARFSDKFYPIANDVAALRQLASGFIDVPATRNITPGYVGEISKRANDIFRNNRSLGTQGAYQQAVQGIINDLKSQGTGIAQAHGALDVAGGLSGQNGFLGGTSNQDQIFEQLLSRFRR